jgi:hypothetical protein
VEWLTSVVLLLNTGSQEYAKRSIEPFDTIMILSAGSRISATRDPGVKY